MSSWSRRDFVMLAAAAASGAAMTAAAAPPAAKSPGGDESLDGIARRRDMRFGSAMAYHQLSDPGYCRLMRTQCGIMVTESELKWPQVEPRAGTFTFERGDALAGFAAGNHLLLRFLEGLRKRNVPVDALGLQSHIGAKGSHAQGAPQDGAWRKFLDEVTAMGYGLLITEFDVNDGPFPTDTTARDRMIADYARRYLDITLSYRQLEYVLTWGLIDKDSWLQRFTPRADGTPRRPLPFGSDYRPKPLYFAMADAFRAAPPR